MSTEIKNKRLCVVIPVHKPDLSPDEVISLKSCKDNLNHLDCFLIFPKGMDTTAYLALFDGLIHAPVDPAWLSSVRQYNKMKTSIDFYNLFINYTFMLTYELDAYIFNSDFEAINAFAFDFIGAPFFEGYWDAKPGASFVKGCNSGFSIRNIQTCIKVLRSMGKYRLQWLIYRMVFSPSSKFRFKVDKWTKHKYEIFVTGQLGFYFSDIHLNEDLVWSRIIPELFPYFKVADPISANRFSFEYNLDASLQINEGKLPLGCHAWFKHYDFWQNYINSDGASL